MERVINLLLWFNYCIIIFIYLFVLFFFIYIYIYIYTLFVLGGRGSKIGQFGRNMCVPNQTNVMNLVPVAPHGLIFGQSEEHRLQEVF